jgi:glycolate oxidase
VVTDEDVRRAYSADASGLVLVPDAVARPDSMREVAEVVRQAAAERTCVTPAGGQTSTTGASITDDGVLLSLRRVARVIDVDAATSTAIVEPGVLLGDLRRALRAEGGEGAGMLEWPPDPTSIDDVTVGGAIACNASGPNTLRYGATRAWVRGITVVLATGDTVELRRTSLEKNTAGFAFVHDPVDWFVGSEGTLGVIVRAELQLIRAEEVLGFGIPCENEQQALARIVELRQRSDTTPDASCRCIEYLDDAAASIAGFGERPYIYMEGDPPPDWDDVVVFDGDKALRDARHMRHKVPATMNERGSAGRKTGGRKVSTDWAVPYQRLGEAIAEARRLARDADIPQPVIYGHAGNGHPHENFIARDAAELERIEATVGATLQWVIAHGGTISAEHGIGKLKRRWLGLQLTDLQRRAMRALKEELDPTGMFAPGNVF